MTKVGGEHSPPAVVTCGIPQGSILGPLLFTIYINDLPLVSNITRWNLYADDPAIMYSSLSKVDMEETLNTTLERVSEWFEYNRLSLNVSKTHLMIFRTQPSCKKMQDLVIEIKGQKINQQDKVKYLGIILDPQLTFKDHIEYVRGKTVGKIKLLSRISSVIKPSTALFLYKSLIRPVFDYCDFLVDGMTQQESDTIQKLQNMSLRNTLGINTLTRIMSIHQTLDVDYLSTRRKQHMATEMYKMGLVPDPVKTHFTDIASTHDRSTWLRMSSNFVIPNFKLELCRRSFMYRGPKL